jgi:hypothetical protein
MKYDYLLQSLAVPGQRYTGIAANLDTRLELILPVDHLHTSKYHPWK